MKGFSDRWKDFPDYIIGITKEIWEDRGIGTLNHYYTDDIPVRSPMGIVQGNQAVIAATMATIDEFPDRKLLAEDVIYSDDPDHGLLSSHRMTTAMLTAPDWSIAMFSNVKRVQVSVIVNSWSLSTLFSIVQFALGVGAVSSAPKALKIG